MPSIVLGIDLGTTNTCIAVMEGDKPRILETAEGLTTMPSALALGPEGQWLIGSAAVRQRVAKPRDTLVGAKRLLGRPAEDVATLQKDYAFELAPLKGSVGVRVGGQEYSVPELSAIVLQHVKTRAEQVMGETIKDAVITVPAYFNERQRQATRDAGLIAGLRVLKVLSEPTAAAVAYGMGRGEGKRVLVFDLGGGTFDVTIIEVQGKKFKVLATGGNTRLGGQDFDKALVDYLAAEFEKEHKVDPRKSPESLSRLQEAAEKTKCELSTTVQSLVNLPFLAVVGTEPKHLQKQVNRALFEQLTQGLVAGCIATAQKVLKDAGLDIKKIDEVLLVGGQTRMPKIQEEVTKFAGKPPSKAINADEAVAAGAAAVGAWIAEEKAGDLIDVLPLPMGLTLAGGKMGVLIGKNTPLPAKTSKQYTTSKDAQTKIKIHVRQGESENANENVILGAFNLLLADAQPKGKPKIEVTFELDPNGILQVTAEELGAGRRGKVLIRPQQDYGSAGVEEDFQAAQQSTADLAKAKKELEAVERLFADLGRGLSATDRAQVDEKLRSLRSAILAGDKAGAFKLLPEVMALGQAHMERLRSGKVG
ncbi:MAG: Hsp70 family protein [Bdellovibrionota bacterium]